MGHTIAGMAIQLVQETWITLRKLETWDFFSFWVAVLIVQREKPTVRGGAVPIECTRPSEKAADAFGI